MRLLAALALLAALGGCATMKAATCASAYFVQPFGLPIAVACAVHDVKEEVSKDDLDV